MFQLPREAALLQSMSETFGKPTAQRFLFLALAAIITMGRRTVSHILWSACCLCEGDPSCYHRFFSQARWSLWPLARILAMAVLELVPADQAVVVEVDDTVAEHRGKRVFGVGCHRDAVRSSWTHTIFKWGHKWVVLAVNVRLPWCRRDWALPVMVALYTPPPSVSSDDEPRTTPKHKTPKHKTQKHKTPKRKTQKRKRPRHKTPALLARQMMAVLMHWFPRRRFILLGDWGFASHDLALFCRRHRDRVTLIARFRSDANLYSLPGAKPDCSAGRHRRKGKKLPGPRQSVARSTHQAQQTVRWYGEGVRELQTLSGCGGWYRGRGGGRAALIPIRWVYTRDPKEGREDYFYSTDPALTPRQIIEHFAGRWNLEVSFEEVRAHLSFESTRMRCENSVKRAGAMLLGLFSVVSLIYARLASETKVKVYGTPCYHKIHPTYADALAAVRTMLWEKVILQHAPSGPVVAKLPLPAWQMLLDHLAAAA